MEGGLRPVHPNASIPSLSRCYLHQSLFQFNRRRAHPWNQCLALWIRGVAKPYLRSKRSQRGTVWSLPLWCSFPDQYIWKLWEIDHRHFRGSRRVQQKWGWPGGWPMGWKHQGQVEAFIETCIFGPSTSDLKIRHHCAKVAIISIIDGKAEHIARRKKIQSSQ